MFRIRGVCRLCRALDAKRNRDIANTQLRKAQVVQTSRHDLGRAPPVRPSKGAGEIVVAGLEVTNSLIDRWTRRSRSSLSPGAFFGDRVGGMQKVGRMQKRDEPIELDAEDFAQVLLVSGEKTPWALVGIFELQRRFLLDASRRPVAFAAPTKEPGPATRSGCVSQRHSLGVKTRNQARLFPTRKKKFLGPLRRHSKPERSRLTRRRIFLPAGNKSQLD
jgi:hypothetical protein